MMLKVQKNLNKIQKKLEIHQKKKDLELKRSKIEVKKNFKIVFSIYQKWLTKIKIKNRRIPNNNSKLLTSFDYFKEVLKKIRKDKSLFSNFNKVTNSEILKLFFKAKKKNKNVLKKTFKKDKKFLTKRLRKILVKFSNLKDFKSTKNRLERRLVRSNRYVKYKKMRRNLRKSSYFFKIIRKKRRRKLNVFRLNRKQPIFTKKTKKETRFLLRARESLLKTKKFLYRKQFPKIKGKKNKNFNFFYYNNMDRAPFKFDIGRIVITYLLNNTFINIHSSDKMLKVISAGRLGFKGPKRSTPYSRQVVARKAINFVAKTKLNVLDIFLNSNYNRWYYFLFKEISKPKVKPYVIRYLVISNSRSHGFIRDRKHRRK